MRLLNYIQIITGINYFHIIIHLLVVTALLCGWKYNLLIEVSSMLILSYWLIFIIMIIIQQNVHSNLINDYLEETTTTYYFIAAIITLFLISHFVHSYVLLFSIGMCMLIGPVLFSLFERESV